MKVGLATPFRVENYGTKLQAYALMYAVRGMGYQAEIINYHHSSDKRFKVLVRKLFRVSSYKSRIENITRESASQSRLDQNAVEKRRLAFQSFDENYLLSPKLQGYRELEKYSLSYDVVICGSDQIWVPANLDTEFFTLEFTSPSCRRISYAASFGVDKIPEGKKRRYQKFLLKFDAISLRENSGAEIVKELIPDSKNVVVCDPTFLLTRDDWENAIKVSYEQIEEKYIFVYLIGKNPEHRKAISRFAKKENCKIVACSHFKGYCEADDDFADVEVYGADPFAFLNLLKNAEYVCTDSMHASIFSLIFHKDFFVFYRYEENDKDSRNTRIRSLMENVAAEERIVEQSPKMENMDLHIKNWNEIDSRIKDLRSRSYQFLERSLMES